MVNDALKNVGASRDSKNLALKGVAIGFGVVILAYYASSMYLNVLRIKEANIRLKKEKEVNGEA